MGRDEKRSIGDVWVEGWKWGREVKGSVRVVGWVDGRSVGMVHRG